LLLWICSYNLYLFLLTGDLGQKCLKVTLNPLCRWCHGSTDDLKITSERKPENNKFVNPGSVSHPRQRTHSTTHCDTHHRGITEHTSENIFLSYQGTSNEKLQQQTGKGILNSVAGFGSETLKKLSHMGAISCYMENGECLPHLIPQAAGGSSGYHTFLRLDYFPFQLSLSYFLPFSLD
jgi:hypothetical protein